MEAVQTNFLACRKVTDLYQPKPSLLPPVVHGGVAVISTSGGHVIYLSGPPCTCCFPVQQWHFIPWAWTLLESACRSQTKIQKDTVWDTAADVKQEFMMALILTVVPVDHEKTKQAVKTALQVVKVVV